MKFLESNGEARHYGMLASVAGEQLIAYGR